MRGSLILAPNIPRGTVHVRRGRIEGWKEIMRERMKGGPRDSGREGRKTGAKEGDEEGAGEGIKGTDR